MNPKTKVRLLAFLGGIALLAVLGIYGCYRIVLAPNYLDANDEPVRLEVYPDTSWDELSSQIAEVPAKYPCDLTRFASLWSRWLSPCSGSYLIRPGTTTAQLFRMLARGRQTPIQLRYNSIRLPQDLYARLASQLMINSTDIEIAMRDTTLLRELSSPYNTLAYYSLPNTYEVYWNISAQDLVQRLYKEYQLFWTSERKEQAANLDLTPEEVVTLASIVQEESSKTDEYPDIAGLYLNRLRIGMLLQADPTVRYAAGDFTIQRVLREHLTIDSPYNTYLNKGLPPTPICLPSIAAIEGVLNARKHSYIYMCAKHDFSGYHAFATTLQEHSVNANLYRTALNRRGIK